MGPTTLQPGPAVHKEAPKIPTPPENTRDWYEHKLGKFFTKNYQFQGKTAQYEFRKQRLSSWAFRIWKYILAIQSLEVTAYPLDTEEGWKKLWELYGESNRAPRQSLIKLFDRKNLILYVLSRHGQPESVSVGAWFDRVYYGAITHL